MKKKNGFIAVSLIYSFFLIFLMVMLASATKSTQTRQLLRTFKDDLQSQLNEEEFVKTTISQKAYAIDEEVNFVDETWQVIKDNNTSVVMILKRALTKDEITNALEVTENNSMYFQNSCNNSECKVKMCLNNFSVNQCYYVSSSDYLYYNWNNSVAKTIVERWFEKNLNLQKACRLQYMEALGERRCQKDTLVRMNFSDGIQLNSGYIRIATHEEVAGAHNWITSIPDTWTLTNYRRTDGRSSVYAFNGTYNTYDTVLKIRPVIEVKKS